jgi:hypothetical protein
VRAARTGTTEGEVPTMPGHHECSPLLPALVLTCVAGVASAQALIDADDAARTLADWVREHEYYDLPAGCVAQRDLGLGNAGYTIELTADGCPGRAQGLLLGRWRVDARTRAVFVQDAAGTFRTPRQGEAKLESLPAEQQRQRVPALLRSLHAERSSTRAWAAYALARLGASAGAALHDLVAAMHDADGGVRTAAASALGRLGPAASSAVPALVAALGDPAEIGRNDDGLMERVRSTAAFALGEIGPGARDAVPALIAALDDEDEIVGDAAAAALERIGTPAARAAAARHEAARNR